MPTPGDARPTTHWFDTALFERACQQRGVTWGRPLRILDSVPSTNDLGLGAVTGTDKTGIVWLAREQTAGRGRRGNVWHAAPGENLTFSVLLRIPGPRTLAMGFSLLAGLAVRAVVAARLQTQSVLPDRTTRVPGGLIEPEEGTVGLRATVKWPNDVFIGPKKCSGILVESKVDSTGQLGVVVGVGLNVLTRNFPDHLPNATSLLLQGVLSSGLGLESLLVDLLAELEQRTRVYLVKGLRPLVDELMQHDFLAGRAVRVADQHGVASGFDDCGQLRLVHSDDSVTVVTAGHVELDELAHP